MNEGDLPKKRGFFAPDNLDLPALLAQRGYARLTKDIHLDKFHYLMHRIYIDRHIRDNDADDQFIPINSEILERVVTKRFAATIKRVLVELGILEENGSYRAGRNSMG